MLARKMYWITCMIIMVSTFWCSWPLWFSTCYSSSLTTASKASIDYLCSSTAHYNTAILRSVFSKERWWLLTCFRQISWHCRYWNKVVILTSWGSSQVICRNQRAKTVKSLQKIRQVVTQASKAAPLIKRLRELKFSDLTQTNKISCTRNY